MPAALRLPSRMALVRATRSAERLSTHVASNPLDYVKWTPPQQRWLSCDHPRKLLRAGNQIGKTWAGLAEVIWRATGTHPFIPTKPPPVEIWIVCTTWPQSVGIMKKFWQLLPKHLIRKTTFDARYGFGKDNPAVVFLNGSIVRFRTTCQGADALAGSTVDFILIDEPTDEEIYRELDRRIMRAGRLGGMGLTLTPINRPTEYLRQLARDEAIFDIHAKLNVENLTPHGARGPLRLLDGTPMDQAWIDEQRRFVLARYQPVILDGEWETRLEGAVFGAFDPDRHVTEEIPTCDLKVLLGFDWGEGDFRTATVLAGVDVRGEFPKLHLLAEHTSDGSGLPEEDALGALDCLDELEWQWKRDVDSAVGDKPTTGRYGRKSNEDLRAALERELRHRGQLGRREILTPAIRQAKTGKHGGAGSKWRGIEWIHRCMVREGCFTAHPRMERTIESITKWMGDDSEWKDTIDASRYAVWPFSHRGGIRGDPGGALVIA